MTRLIPGGTQEPLCKVRQLGEAEHVCIWLKTGCATTACLYWCVLTCAVWTYNIQELKSCQCSHETRAGCVYVKCSLVKTYRKYYTFQITTNCSGTENYTSALKHYFKHEIFFMFNNCRFLNRNETSECLVSTDTKSVKCCSSANGVVESLYSGYVGRFQPDMALLRYHKWTASVSSSLCMLLQCLAVLKSTQAEVPFLVKTGQRRERRLSCCSRHLTH